MKKRKKEKGIKEEEKLKRKSLKTSILEGSAYAVSEGAGIRYISPFALQMGAKNTHIALLTSLPSLIGNFSQLFSPKILEKGVPRKKVAFFGALLQAIMWLFIIGIGMLFFIFGINSNITPALLIFVYTILILCGAFYGPVWNSWMRDLVSKKSGRYFGIRSRIVGTVSLVTALIAGFVLDYFKHTKIFFGFIILFSVAFIARTISAVLFLKKYEPKLECEKEYYFSFWQFVKKMAGNNFGRFVIYMSLFNIAVYIASPFFAVYMLKNLKFSYTNYMLVTLSSSLASLLFVSFWGKFADKYGHIKILRICGLLIPLVPILWLFWGNVYFLIIVEFFSGLVWAGFNFTAGNFVYDAVTRQRMTICVAYMNFLNAIGVFIGATIGGILSSTISIGNYNSILLVFLLSGILRLAISIIMLPKIKEVKEVKPFTMNHVKRKIMRLEPRKIFDILDIRKIDF